MHISRADEWTQFLWNVQGKQHVSTVQLTLMERGCSLAKMCLLSIKLIEFPSCVLQHLLNSCHLNFAQTVLQSALKKSLKPASHPSVHFKGCISRALPNCGIGLVTGGCGTLLLSGLSVSYSPLLSDRCCRHRSVHHAFVKAPLLHPPPFRWMSTPHSHHTYIYVLTGSLLRLACTFLCTHAHMNRNSSHYGDKSCLSWLLSVSHGMACCTSQSPPSSAFHRWIRWVSNGIVWWSWPRDSFIFEPPVVWMENRHIVPKLWGAKVWLSNKGVGLIITAWLHLIH